MRARPTMLLLLVPLVALAGYATWLVRSRPASDATQHAEPAEATRPGPSASPDRSASSSPARRGPSAPAAPAAQVAPAPVSTVAPGMPPQLPLESIDAGTPTTRFAGPPSAYADATVDEALQAAYHGGTAIERARAVELLGQRAPLTRFDNVQWVQAHDPSRYVRAAAEKAAGDMRTRFAGKQWPGVVKANPTEYYERVGAQPPGRPHLPE